MYDEAIARQNDAQLLISIPHSSDSDYLLNLLAFELLLKAVVKIHNDTFPPSHNYKELFDLMPGNTRNEILDDSYDYSGIKQIDKSQIDVYLGRVFN